MTTEAYRRPAISAVLLLAALISLALCLPKLISPPELVAAIDAGCTDPAFRSLAGSPIPLVEFSCWLDRLIAGDRGGLAAIMHGHNLLAHFLATLVLAGLLIRLGVGRTRAGWGAALFAVHPTTFEAVSIVGFRSAILGGLFVFLCLASVARGVSTRRRIHALPAGLFAVLAAAASPFAAVVLPWLGYLVGARVAGRGVVPAVGLVFPVLSVLVLYQAWPLPLESMSMAALAAPLAAIFVPAVPASLGAPLGTGIVGASIGVGLVLLVAVLAIALRRRQPSLSTGLGLVAVGVLPAVWQSPLAPDVAGYLVIAGLAVVVASLRLPRLPLVALASVAILGMVVVDWSRDWIYRDAGSLFSTAALTPLGRALHGEQLASSSDGATQKRAITALAEALPQLSSLTTRRRIQEAYVRVLSRQGQAGDASLAAEEMCRIAEAIGDRESSLQAYLMTAECFSIENHRAKVDEFIAKARALAPRHPEVLAARGEREFAALVVAADAAQKSNWIESGDARLVSIEALADQALRADPDCFRASLLKGRILEARGDVLDALPHFERAITAAPTRAAPRLLLERLFLANDMAEQARECIDAALHDGIDDPRVHYRKVLLLAGSGDLAGAQQYLEAYVKNHVESEQARVMLANMLSAHALRIEDTAQPAELRRLSERIAELNPEDPKGYLVRAEVLMRRKPPKFKNYIDAIVLIENARLAMPGDAEVLRRLATAHRDFGWKLFLSSQQALAMDHFQKFLILAPDSVERGPVRRTYDGHCRRLRDRGLKDLEAGQGKAAAASLHRLTELKPESAVSHFQLGLARMEESKHKDLEVSKLTDAVACIDKAIDLGRADKADVSVYFLPLIDALIRMGRPTEARQRAESFLKNPGPSTEEVLQKIRRRIAR